jgi:phage shock protein PspC (stress-responsive transcriptional regulator)
MMKTDLKCGGGGIGSGAFLSLKCKFLLQAYGLKFIINVEGLARKFSLKNTVLNVGNGLALLGITTVLCEFVLMYFIKVIIITYLKNIYFPPPCFRTSTQWP